MKNLAIYLNDHLAGSVGALEMLDELIEAQKDHALGAFLKSWRIEIGADQRELKRLMTHLGIEESSVRKAGAWIAEKISRVKLGSSDAQKPDLAFLQSLESLSLGISGKRSLWRNLGAVAESEPSLSDFDFGRLEKRAADQFEQVQTKVREVAVEIFPAELQSKNR
ncbi:MAG: hypothetical protein ACXWGY_08115 [Chthoniobacterales bacterium]